MFCHNCLESVIPGEGDEEHESERAQGGGVQVQEAVAGERPPEDPARPEQDPREDRDREPPPDQLQSDGDADRRQFPSEPDVSAHQGAEAARQHLRPAVRDHQQRQDQRDTDSESNLPAAADTEDHRH